MKERAYRKAINFDLSQEKIREHYGGNRTKAYSDIKSFFYKNDFEWRQGSGYVSNKELSNTDVADLADRLHAALPWLKDCVKEIDVTNIVGDVHSMKALLEYAALAQAAEREEYMKPASMLDSIRKKGEEYQKKHQQGDKAAKKTHEKGIEQ